MASFWKNASIMAIAEIFLKLKALIMMPFITKYLGAINYGIWSQVMIIVSLLSPLVFCGMDNSLFRFLPGQSLETQKQDFTGWFIFGLTTSTVLLAAVYFLSQQFSELFFGTAAEYPMFVVLAGFNIVTTSLLTGLRNWFRVQNNAWSLVALTVAQNILQMFILIWVLMQEKGIYELVFWSLIIDALMAFICVSYMFKMKIFKKPKIDWLKPYFRFGIMLLPSGYAIWVLNSLDRVFLAQYHSLEDIGIYSICFTIGYTLIQIVVNPIWNLFPTKAAELYNTRQIEELNKLFNESIKFICWVIFPTILGLVVIGEPLLKILTTEEFSVGYLVMPIILLGYLFLMLSAYFESILALKHKPYLSSIFTVSACVMNIFLNFILIPRFSYLGAAVATTLSFSVQLFLSVFYANKEKVVFFNYQQILKMFSITTLMFVLIFCLKKEMRVLDEKNLIMILILSGMVIYAFLSHITKIYRVQDMMAFLLKGKNVRASA